MPAYSWRCLACELANEAASENCQKCGCPANATYQQISAAKKSAGIVEPVDGPTFSELVADGWKYFLGKGRDRSVPLIFLYEAAKLVVVTCVLLVLLKACDFLG